jgi:hypothetical protein
MNRTNLNSIVLLIIHSHRARVLSRNPVLSENSVRAGNAEVMILVEIRLPSTMNAVFVALFALVTSTFQNRAALHAEILALRHQLAAFKGMRRVVSALAESLRGTADRFRSPRMFGPFDRMESAILASNSTKLFCLLPALPNASSPSKGRPRVESSGEAGTRAHRSDSSGWRTSPPIPAPGRLGGPHKPMAPTFGLLLRIQPQVL